MFVFTSGVTGMQGIGGTRYLAVLPRKTALTPYLQLYRKAENIKRIPTFTAGVLNGFEALIILI